MNLWIEPKTLFPLSRQRKNRVITVLPPLRCVFSSTVFLPTGSGVVRDLSFLHLASLCSEVALRTEPEQAKFEMFLVSALTEDNSTVLTLVCTTESLKLDLLSTVLSQL